MITTARLFILCLLAIFVTSCSAIDWAYNNAPSFAADEIAEAFDLDSAQTEQVEARLSGFFGWHRRQELPRYEAMLQRASMAVGDGLSTDEVLWLVGEMRAIRSRTMARALDDIAELSVQLTADQIDHFDAHYRERVEDREDYLKKSAQQREIQRGQRDIERLEDWFGDIDEPLRSRVLERLAQIPDLRESWFRYSDARHDAVVAVLRGNGDGDARRAQLQRILVDEDTDFARAYEPYRQAFWQAYAAALADISEWLTPRHYRAAAERLDRYAMIATRLQQPD